MSLPSPLAAALAALSLLPAQATSLSPLYDEAFSNNAQLQSARGALRATMPNAVAPH